MKSAAPLHRRGESPPRRARREVMKMMRRVLVCRAHADALRGLVAVHPGHLDVHQDHRELAVASCSTRLRPTRLDDRVAEGREGGTVARAPRLVVADDEDRDRPSPAGSVRAVRFPHRASGSRRASCGGARVDRSLGSTARAGVRASNDSHASTGFPGRSGNRRSPSGGPLVPLDPARPQAARRGRRLGPPERPPAARRGGARATSSRCSPASGRASPSPPSPTTSFPVARRRHPRALVPAGGRRRRAAPLVVYFHGGGWLLGSIDSHDGICRVARERLGRRRAQRRLPPRARGALPRGGRRRARRHALGARQRRARSAPTPAASRSPATRPAATSRRWSARTCATPASRSSASSC